MRPGPLVLPGIGMLLVRILRIGGTLIIHVRGFLSCSRQRRDRQKRPLYALSQRLSRCPLLSRLASGERLFNNNQCLFLLSEPSSAIRSGNGLLFLPLTSRRASSARREAETIGKASLSHCLKPGSRFVLKRKRSLASLCNETSSLLRIYHRVSKNASGMKKGERSRACILHFKGDSSHKGNTTYCRRPSRPDGAHFFR